MNSMDLQPCTESKTNEFLVSAFILFSSLERAILGKHAREQQALQQSEDPHPPHFTFSYKF